MTLWLGTLRQWHWISSALCLAGMLMFAITGITLNHAGQIEGKAQVVSQQLELPESLLQQLQNQSGQEQLPPEVQQWLEQSLNTRFRYYEAEWSDDELYLDLPRPGGDAWLSVDLSSGQLEFENTERGWIAYFNDLHKGRDSGVAWGWFIDIFAAVCIVFCISGLLLLQRHANARPSTWPVTSLGLLIPVLLALLLVH